MIGNIVKGRGFGGAARYALEKDGAEFVASSFAGESWKDMRAEVAHLHQFVRAEKACFHASLSLPPGETLGREQWAEIARTYLQEMGFGSAPFVAVRHTDTDHDHLHVVAMRVNLETGKTPSEWKDYEHSEKVVRQLEVAYGLSSPGRSIDESRERALRPEGRAEIAYAERTDATTPRETIARALKEVLAQSERPTTLPAFVEAMKEHGVSVEPHIQGTGRLAGLNYRDEASGYALKASKLGKAFGAPALQKYGISYDAERDVDRLGELARGRAPEADRAAGGREGRGAADARGGPGADAPGIRPHPRGAGRGGAHGRPGPGDVDDRDRSQRQSEPAAHRGAGEGASGAGGGPSSRDRGADSARDGAAGARTPGRGDRDGDRGAAIDVEPVPPRREPEGLPDDRGAGARVVRPGSDGAMRLKEEVEVLVRGKQPEQEVEAKVTKKSLAPDVDI